MLMLKEIFVKFVIMRPNNILQIEQSKRGKDIKVDLRIGYLHAYPNGELQFENYDFKLNPNLEADKYMERVLDNMS